MDWERAWYDWDSVVDADKDTDKVVPGQRPAAGGGDGRGGGAPDIVGVVQEQDCGSGNAGVGRCFHRGVLKKPSLKMLDFENSYANDATALLPTVVKNSGAYAKDLGDYLIVGVTSDTFDQWRGKLSNRNNVLEQ